MSLTSMAFYNKVGLLVLSADRKKFLVCEPGGEYHNIAIYFSEIQKKDAALITEYINSILEEKIATKPQGI